MIDFRPLLFVIGILLTTIAVIMCLPAIADGAVDNPDWQVFAASALITLSLGICLILGNRSDDFRFTIHQAFLLTTLSWLVIALFGSLPFMFSNLDLSFTDAFFEAMSGITTTGSTVITGLDFAPPGILLWRALLQWLGGIGIIVMAIAVLPMLRVGGMQLFHMESSDTSDKVMPRAAQIASGIGLIYVSLTLICGGALWLSGMSGFQAIAHAMTTIATGGFSTSDDSVGHFNSA
ncbi:MAG: potassium transporter TrkG, partial [Alphaproteobacteria bacterium]|nr:potassium transporter TrkG [Alphaproteobacteria bacterium]